MKSFGFRVLLAAIPIAIGGSAGAVSLQFGASSFSSNTPETGASALVTLTLSDVLAGSTAKLTVNVENTTGSGTPFGSGAQTGTLTAFGFNLLAGMSLSNFAGGLALDTELTTATLTPFNALDVWASDDNNLQGGNANSALAKGDNDTVMWDLDYSNSGFANASALDAAWQSYFDASPAGTKDDARAIVRFMQVDAGAGSDKLKYVLPPVPLNASLPFLAASLGLGGLMFRKRRRVV